MHKINENAKIDSDVRNNHRVYWEMRMTKLVVFDLDNTLAELGKGITSANIDKLKQIEALGIQIAICSGKPVSYLCGFMRQVGLESPILIGENGAVLQMGVELPPKEQYVLSYSRRAKESLTMIKREIDSRIENIWYQPNLVGVTPFPKNETEFDVIEKLLIEKKDIVQDVKIYRHVDSFDIVPVGIDKKAGIHLLAQQLHLQPEEMIAVGDGVNDYPMFAYAGTALGVNVKDERFVDQNFETIEAILDFLCKRCEEERL